MNSKMEEARKILFDLSKKYSIGNTKKIKKPISSSSDELSSEEEVQKSLCSSKKSSLSNITVLSSNHSIKSITSSNCKTDKVTKNVETVLGKDNVSESSFILSQNRIDSREMQFVKKSKSSESNMSSIRSDIQDDIHSAIEEDFSEASDSSPVSNVLANVHLISDDALEDLETIISSDHSNIDQEGRSTRLSVVHSIKSIQLGSPIELPDLDDINYESDFEVSDSDTNEFSKSQKTIISSGRSVDSSERLVSINNKEYDAVEENEEVALSLRTSLESQLKSNVGDNISLHSSGTKDSHLNKEIKLDYVTSRSETIEECPSASSYVHDHILVNDDKLSQFKPSSTLHTSISSAKPTIDKIKKVSKDISTNNEASNYILNSNEKSSRNNESSELEVINSVVESYEEKQKICDRIDIGVNKPAYISKSVQVNRLDESFVCDSMKKCNQDRNRRSKKYFIDTSVRNIKARPVVNAAELNSLEKKDTEYTPYTFTYRENLSVEEYMNEMLRSQIAMTRHFIQCHHRLYLECCQTVQSMNEDYKKNRICFISHT